MKTVICDICKAPIRSYYVLSRYIFYHGLHIKAKSLRTNEKVDICPDCAQRIIDEVRGCKK